MSAEAGRVTKCTEEALLRREHSAYAESEGRASVCSPRDSAVVHVVSKKIVGNNFAFKNASGDCIKTAEYGIMFNIVDDVKPATRKMEK